MQIVSGWESAVGVMLIENRVWHYKELWTRIREIGNSGINPTAETPEETLGRELREKPEYFSNDAKGHYWLNEDAIPMALQDSRIAHSAASLANPLLEEYRSKILRLMSLGCISSDDWSQELADEEKEKLAQVEELESIFSRIINRNA